MLQNRRMTWECETARLRVSPLTLDDAPFILRLLNEPSFISAIADKGVRTLDDARNYLRTGPLASYARHGFGMGRVVGKDSGEVIGMCGLIRREGFTEVEVGYALLPEHAGRGFATEAVRAVLDNGACQFALQRVIAVVNPDNTASQRVLVQAGFCREGEVTLPGETRPIHQFGRALKPCMRLTPQHAPVYRALMLEAYARHPDAFTSSPAEREALPLAWWEQRLRTDPASNEVVLGAFADGALVGAAGLARETREKARHKATLFGMVVQDTQRQRGLGRLLVEAVLAQARSQSDLRQVVLTVTQGNTRAEALYARCGFQTFGMEPDAVAVGDVLLAKVHMWHKLERPMERTKSPHAA
jgi:RimJ/RimL family protein N-acetyltransferase